MFLNIYLIIIYLHPGEACAFAMKEFKLQS